MFRFQVEHSKMGEFPDIGERGGEVPFVLRRVLVENAEKSHLRVDLREGEKRVVLIRCVQAIVTVIKVQLLQAP